MATTLGDIQVRPLTSDDATPDIAQGVMAVHLEAYVKRFGEEYRLSLMDALRAHPQNDLEVTLQQLRNGRAEGWYWVAALEESADKITVHGFALCIVRDQNILLAEIHTHPRSQRQGLGRMMLEQVILAVLDGPDSAQLASLPLVLNVARERPDDQSEHPAAWYRRAGFVEIGKGYDFDFGTRQIPTVTMRSGMSWVLKGVRRHSAD